MKQFRLHRMLNNNNPTITNPFTRVALALTYIRGEHVDLWAQQYADYLAGCVSGVNGQPPTNLPTNKALWTEFATVFNRQFRNMAEAERAWRKLQTIEMKDKDIN